MSKWQEIESAPKNDPGESYGPWVLGFHEYDHGQYQVRWECHGNKRGWHAKGAPTGFFSHHLTRWMPLPDPPTALKQEA